MSYTLEQVLAQAAEGSSMTVMLSANSMAVLFFAASFLDKKRNWLDRQQDNSDTITDADWDTIEALVAGLIAEASTPMLIGLVVPVLTEILPPNMLPMDGSIYDGDDYPELFAVIDETLKIGGDQFILPNLAGYFILPFGLSSYGFNFPLHTTGGQRVVTLAENNLPSHTHSYSPPGSPSLAVAPGELPVVTPALLPASTGAAGAGVAHENMPPYITARYGVIAK